MKKGRFTILRCEMTGVHAVSADTSFSFGRHTHDQFGIGLIDRGAQVSMSGRGIVEAKVGDIITVNPGEVHDGSPLGAESRSWRMLYFEPDVLSGVIQTLTESRSGCVELSNPVVHNHESATYFSTLFRALTDSCGGYSEIEREETLLFLLTGLLGYQHQEGAVAPRAIALARERIDDDPSLPLSLDELSDLGGVSQFQLLRGFSKVTGLTPHAYLIQRRLQRVRQLIAGGMPLADASHAAGFADQSHMTRLFVRTYGITPGVYAVAIK
ncbi:AraC family transcriptional regulator [Serratia sp. L9]|uniref:AraC family transcriptional regulator n=1 Tax=Serratia sp. L9 TaxID=3423946 RepID=UPI003D673DFF